LPSRLELDLVLCAQGLINLGFEPLVDFIVQDDGDGPSLREWLSGEPQPTAAEIAAAGDAEPVPVSVAPAQAEIALLDVGLLDTVETLVADYPYRPVSIWWANASRFERGNAYIGAQAGYGWTDFEYEFNTNGHYNSAPATRLTRRQTAS